MNNRTKAVDVAKNVREEVLERDMHRCIFCKKSQALTMAHIIPRSQGGLGIKENIVTACSKCHHMLDHSQMRKVMLEYAQRHVDKFHARTKRAYERTI